MHYQVVLTRHIPAGPQEIRNNEFHPADIESHLQIVVKSSNPQQAEEIARQGLPGWETVSSTVI